MNTAAYDLKALADYHEITGEPITPHMLRQLAMKYEVQDDNHQPECLTPEETHG